MYIVQAGYKIIDIDNPVEKIERVARVCYKSEDKITEGSAERMVKALIKNSHTAMIEHSSIVLEADISAFYELDVRVNYLEQRTGFKSYLRFSTIDDVHIISGNIRAWREFLTACEENMFSVSKSLSDIFTNEKYSVFFNDIEIDVSENMRGNVKEINPSSLSAKGQLIHRDFTVLFTVDRGESHELVRHRVASFAQESTRYCNYSKADSITVIRPCYFKENTPEMDNWAESCIKAEKVYMKLLEKGATPQEARAVLPNSLKTEIVVTMNLRQWRHFFKLRAVGVTGAPHPQMLEVSVPLLEEVKSLIPIVFDDLEVK